MLCVVKCLLHHVKAKVKLLIVQCRSIRTIRLRKENNYQSIEA
jgi:hypothetical protein